MDYITAAEFDRAAAEQEFLDRHSGGRKPTAAHPDCRCLDLTAHATSRGEPRPRVLAAIRTGCPVHGKVTP